MMSGMAMQDLMHLDQSSEDSGNDARVLFFLLSNGTPTVTVDQGVLVVLTITFALTTIAGLAYWHFLRQIDEKTRYGM